MNYLRVYCNLIRKAEKRSIPKGYVEKHHTFPKSIFGKNNRIVYLTAKEHFVAHLLLEKSFNKRYGKNHIKTKKALHAVIYMGQKYINSRLYSRARERFSKQMSGLGAPRSKLTEEEVKVIRWYYFRKKQFSNITQLTLSKFFGISVDVMGKLIRKETWKYIDDIEILPKKYNYLPLLIKMGWGKHYLET